MADVIPLRDDPHQPTELLLPWYSIGTLDELEYAEVAAHLGNCAQCLAAAESERRLAEEVRELPLSADLGWEKLQRRLAPPMMQESGRRSARHPWNWRGRWSRGVVLAAALAAQAAVVAALVIVVHPARDPVYHTLGETELRSTGNVVVMFVPDVTERDLRTALGSIDARIVDGPTAAGAYVLRVQPDQRDVVLERLRRRSDVILAQPVDPSGP